MKPSRRAIRLVFLALVAAVVAAGLAACGGGSGNNDDPQKVLDETFASGKDYSKGKVDVALKVNASGDQGGSLDATIKGPYQGGNGGFPQFDFDADVNLEQGGSNTQGFQGGLISSGDSAYLNFSGTDYKLDEGTFKNFEALYAGLQSQGKSGDQPSVLDPGAFLTDLKNEGTEDIEGAKAVHISGNVDINKLVDQVQAAPGANKKDTAQLDQLRSSVKSAQADIYSGEDDKRLRKIDVNAVFTPPASQTGGNETEITLVFSLTFSELGQDQTITAPTSSKPLAELLKALGAGGTGLGQALGGGSGSGSGASADTGAAAGPSAPSQGTADAYVQCLTDAKGKAALDACAQLAPQ
jgi:hypothetical protein